MPGVKMLYALQIALVEFHVQCLKTLSPGTLLFSLNKSNIIPKIMQDDQVLNNRKQNTDYSPTEWKWFISMLQGEVLKILKAPPRLHLWQPQATPLPQSLSPSYSPSTKLNNHGGKRLTCKCMEKLIHRTMSSSVLTPASEKPFLCSKQGKKSAISKGFFLRHESKSSLLIFPSLSESNKLNSPWTCK